MKVSSMKFGGHDIIWQHKWAFCESIFCENLTFHQFMKVFSCEGFSLYSSTLTELNVSSCCQVHGSNECCSVEHVGIQSSVSGYIQCHWPIFINTWNNPFTFKSFIACYWFHWLQINHIHIKALPLRLGAWIRWGGCSNTSYKEATDGRNCNSLPFKLLLFSWIYLFCWTLSFNSSNVNDIEP